MTLSKNRLNHPRFTVFWLIICLILLELFFFRALVFSPDALVGDAGDGRFNALVLEHAWRTLSGLDHPTHLSIFYPTPNTLGFSDTNFLLAIPFCLLRFFGISWLSAYSLTLILVHFFGGLCLLYLFRRLLKLHFFPSLIGLIIANFSNSYFIMSGHPQLFVLSLVPLFIILLWHFVLALRLPPAPVALRRQLLFGIPATLLFAALTLSNIYTAFFVAWFLGFAVVIFLILLFWKNRPYFFQLFAHLKTHRLVFFICSAVLIISFLPFLRVYLPAAAQLDMTHRPWREMMPMWYDFTNVSPTNLVWGGAVAALYPSAREYQGELQVGFPFLTFALFLLLIFFAIRHFFARQKLPPTHLLYISAILTVLAIMLVIVRWPFAPRIGLWYLFYLFVPAANSIRAVARFNFFLTLPIGILLAFSLNFFNTSAATHIFSPARRHFLLLFFPLLTLLIFLEHINTAPLSRARSSDMLAYLSSVPSPPADCQSFFLVGKDDNYDLVVQSLNAWMIANQYHLPALNGYSGNFPDHYPKFTYPELASPSSSISRWLDLHRLSSVCYYDQTARTWQSYPTVL